MPASLYYSCVVPGAPQFSAASLTYHRPQFHCRLLQFKLRNLATNFGFSVQILRYRRELERNSRMNCMGLPITFILQLVHPLCVFLLILAMRLLQLRRERIAERMKALQELVPNANKVDQFFPLSFLFSPLFSFCPFF